jgi:hypothetical protein
MNIPVSPDSATRTMKWSDVHGWSQSNPTGVGNTTTDPVVERRLITALDVPAEGLRCRWTEQVANQPGRSGV